MPRDVDPNTAVIIGLSATCRQLERQLDLLPHRPISIGWILADDDESPSGAPAPVLGGLESLETMVARRRPGLALVCLPAAMKGLIASVRTRLRRLGVPDRFMPTLEDQLAGIGPRTHLDIDLAALLDRPPRPIDDRGTRAVIEGRRVLITGAGGSIGSELARIAAAFNPSELLLVDRAENALFEIDRQIARRHPLLPRRAVLHDVVDAPRTLELFHRATPQVIFHAAAHKHVPMMEDHPGEAVDNNLFGTKSAADAADASGAERFVMISTDKAVNPSSIMGATKRLAERYIQHLNPRSGTVFSMVRFGNVLGSSGSVLDIWSRQLADGGPVTITDPRMTRYFMTIPEAATLVIQSAALVDPDCRDGEVFVLDMGEPIRILDLARRFIGLYGLESRYGREHDSATGPGCVRIICTGARPGEKIFEELATDAQSIQPTRHPDIHIWHLPRPAAQEIEQTLLALDPARRPQSGAAVAKMVRALVPEHGLRKSCVVRVQLGYRAMTCGKTQQRGPCRSGEAEEPSQPPRGAT